MAVRLTDKILPVNDAFVGMVDANQVIVDSSVFTKNLSITDINLQLALQTLDQLIADGAISWGNIIGNIDSQSDLHLELSNKAAVNHSHTFDELSNVGVSSGLSSGQILTYDSTSGLWFNWTPNYVTGTPWISEGYLTEETDPLSLHLDQTTPQTVVNGTPTFNEGIKSSLRDNLGFTSVNANDRNLVVNDGGDTVILIDWSGSRNLFSRWSFENVDNAVYMGTKTVFSAFGFDAGIYDTSLSFSIDPNDRILYGSDGTTKNIDYTGVVNNGAFISFSSTGAFIPYLEDISENLSISPDARSLSNSAANTTFDWENLKFPTLTTDGFLKTSNSDGTIIVDTNTYLTSADLSGYVPYTGASGNVELGMNSLSAFSADFDYLLRMNNNAYLGIGSGDDIKHLWDGTGYTITGVPSTTLAANDLVFVQDADDSSYVKTVTAQAIADLGGGSGDASFIDLNDVPSSYSGSAYDLVRVNATNDGLEFFTPSYITDLSAFDTDDLSQGTDPGRQYANINTRTKTIGITIDGGGSAITTGQKGYFFCPWGGTIKSVTLIADQVGSIVIDIWKDSVIPDNSDSITGATPPTLSSEQTSYDNSLVDWSILAIQQADYIGYNVDSASTVTRVTLILEVET